MLGGFLGYERKNLDGVMEKVCAWLLKWKCLLPQLSPQGRVLVANNLVVSTLWLRLIMVTPPIGWIEVVQRTIVDFFWSGQLWMRPAVLFLSVEEGGQWLADVVAKMASFQLNSAKSSTFM